MTQTGSRRSTLHLQMGQETIYLLLTVAVFAAVLMAAFIARERQQYKDPPIITLTEANGFYFEPGSPELSPQFQRQLAEQVVPRLKAGRVKYDAPIVEVIGHTDEVPLGGGLRAQSDLDRTLVPWFLNSSEKTPNAYDNVGLGMARAVAVARALRNDGLGAGFTIVPLSAGPFLRPNDTVTDGSTSAADEKRRRIEIRLRRPHT